MYTSRNKYFASPIALLMVLTTQVQADWCRDQGVECIADPIVTEIQGSLAAQRLVRSTVTQIASYLDQTCLYGARRPRQQRRNLCGDRFLQNRLDQIEFVSDLAQRGFQLPRSAMRVVQDCSGLRLQVSSRILESAAGLQFFKKALEESIPAIASQSESRFNIAILQAQSRFASRAQYHPVGSRYEPAVSWNLNVTRRRSMSSEAGYTYFAVPEAFFLATTLSSDRLLPRQAVSARCLQATAETRASNIYRPENLGFPPLSTSIRYPNARVQACVENRYRHFWEYRAYKWRESYALAVENNPVLFNAIIEELDRGYAGVLPTSQIQEPDVETECLRILASDAEMPLEIRYHYQLLQLRFEAQRYINPVTRAYDVPRLHQTGFRQRLDEFIRWCVQGDPCYCYNSKLHQDFFSLLRPYGDEAVDNFERELDLALNGQGPAFSQLCQQDMNSVFGRIWQRLLRSGSSNQNRP